jgi:hypothetical protein
MCSNKWIAKLAAGKSWIFSQLQSNPQTCQEGKKGVKMATEGHRCGQDRDHQQKNKVEIEKELKEIRE